MEGVRLTSQSAVVSIMKGVRLASQLVVVKSVKLANQFISFCNEEFQAGWPVSGSFCNEECQACQPADLSL